MSDLGRALTGVAAVVALACAYFIVTGGFSTPTDPLTAQHTTTSTGPQAGAADSEGSKISNTASHGKPARIAVKLDPRAKIGSKNLSLVIIVSAYTPSAQSADAAIVKLNIPGLDAPISVGGFSVFPHQKFDSGGEGGPRRYSFQLDKEAQANFDAAKPNETIAEVKLVDSINGEPVNDASMTIEDVRIVER